MEQLIALGIALELNYFLEGKTNMVKNSYRYLDLIFEDENGDNFSGQF